MVRVALWLALLFAAFPAYANIEEDIEKAIFEDGSIPKVIKPGFRGCKNDADCTAVMSLCRWRPVNKKYEKKVSDISGQLKLECKWPPPPPEAPPVKCIDRLCEIPSDGKYY